MPLSFILLALAMCVLAALFIVLPARAASRQTGQSWGLTVSVFAALILLGTASFYRITSEWNWAPNGLSDAPVAQQLYALRKAVHDNEDSAKGWTELGQFYLEYNQIPAAVEALEKSLRLTQGRNVDINLSLVEALALRGAPNDAQRSAEILSATLKLEPGNRKALWYGGEVAATLEQWDVAILRWQVMLDDARGVNSDEARSVTQMLEQRIATALAAKEQGGEASSSEASPSEAVRIQVRLDKSVAQTPSLTAATPLFVFIRASGESGPPLAVHRSSVGQLPLNVVLSDADAMMPTRKISDFDNLEIVARIALGGKPTLTPGDLFGRVELDATALRQVQIAIDQIAELP